MRTLAIVLLLAAAGAASAQTQSDPPKMSATAVFMRHKLSYSQRIIEGIALENYDEIVTNAIHIWDMSQTNTWVVVKNPDYAARTANFQKDVLALIQEAHLKDTPGVLDVYARVTADCVYCHQTCRRAQFIRAQPQHPAQPRTNAAQPTPSLKPPGSLTARPE